MTVLASLLFLFSCFAVGWMFAPSKARFMRDVSLATGLGIGLVSFTHFIFISVWPAGNYAWFHWALFACALVAIAKRRSTFERTGAPLHIALMSLLIVGGLCLAYVGVRENLAEPHGTWDGWAIWNLHARFLALGGADWTAQFTPALAWSHPDYPLMLPSAIAAGWRATATETVQIPILIALVFSAATVTLLVGAISAESDRNRGVLAGLVLLATPKFWQNGTIQTADIPLAFFIVAAMVLTWRADQTDGWRARRASLAFAGLSASLAAWTKNEGLVFFALFIPAILCLRLLQVTEKQAFKDIGVLLAGAAPGLLIVGCFKVFLSTPNEFQNALTMERLLDSARYAEVLRLMLHFGSRFGGDTGISPAWLLLPCAILAGPRLRPGAGYRLAVVGAFFGLMILVYSLVYQITPYALEWHVYSSFDRLLIQIWPASVFVVFASLLPAAPIIDWQGRYKTLIRMAPLLVTLTAFIIVYQSFPATVPAVPTNTSAAQRVIRVEASSPIRSGWGRLTLPSEASAWMVLSLKKGAHTTEIVSLAAAPAKSGIVPLVGEGKTAIAMLNPGPVPAVVTLSCGDRSLGTFSIPAQRKVAALSSDAPFQAENCSGTLYYNSPVEVATTILLMSVVSGNDVITEIPVPRSEQLDPRPVYIPCLTPVCDLVMANPNDLPLQGTYGWGNRTQPYRVSPRSVTRVKIAGPSAIEVIPSEGFNAPEAFALLEGATVVRGQKADTAFDALLESHSDSTVDSVITAINPSSQQATLRFQAGGRERTIRIPAHTQVSEQALPFALRGVVEITADQAIALAVVRVRADHRTIVVAPAIPAAARSGSAAFFPHYAAGEGYASEFVLVDPAAIKLY